MKFSLAGFLRSLPAWIALMAVGCTQMPHRLWDSASGRSYSNQTRFQVARLQEAQGDVRSLQKAEQAYRDIYKRDPRNVAALHRLAIVTARQNKFNESTAHFQKAIQVAPTRPNLLADYGHALFLKGDLKNAETALKTAVDQNPGNRKAINNLAFVVGIQGRVDESFAIYRKIHSEAEAHNNLGYVHSQRGEGQLAFNSYSKAIALNPGLDSAKHALAQLAEVGHRYQKTVLAGKLPAKSKTSQASLNTLNAQASSATTRRAEPKTAETRVRKTPVRVAARSFPKQPEPQSKARSTRRTPTSDYVLDLSGTGPSKQVVQRASAESTKTKVEPIPTVPTTERFRSSYVIQSTSDEPAQKKTVRPETNTNSGARRIPEQASRHFAREVKPAQTAPEVKPAPTTPKSQEPAVDSNDRFSRSATTRARTARKNNLFNNDGFSWAQRKQPKSQQTPKTENNVKTNTPVETSKPKPFPKVSRSTASRHPVKTVEQKLNPAATKSTVRPRSYRQNVATRESRDTRSEIEAPHKPVTRTIQRVGYETSADELNLGNGWNTKPAKQTQPRYQSTSPNVARSAVAAKSTITSQRSPQSTAAAVKKPEAKDPKRFANYVDWSKTEKENAATDLKKQAAKPTTTVARSVETKTAPPKASGWAPKRRAVATAVAANPKTANVVVTPTRARPQTQTSTESARVRRAPAPQVDSKPVRFKIRSADYGEPSTGRVRLAPTRREQRQPARSTEAKGRVRLSAE